MIDAAGAVSESLARWRADARRCLTAEIAPGEVIWQDDGSATQLFGAALPDVDDKSSQSRVPRRFIPLAASVACHRDPERWSLLYDALWRLTHDEAHLLEVASDRLMFRLIRMHRAVRRASHKMKAFVRFRAIAAPDEEFGEFVAWFEPAHRVVERTGPFFAERFPSMRWSIFTPDGCARWDGASLRLTPGIERHEVPDDADALEELWRTYYAGTFNPARLNHTAMRAEMPARYWKHLPEARVISELSRGAPARVSAMIAQTIAEPTPLPSDLEAIESAPAPPRAPIEEKEGWHPVHDPGWRAARARAELVAANASRPLAVNDSTILSGVAGWTDPTLLAADVFYPRAATTPEERLRHYTSQLSMVEVDATYYVMPSVETAQRWAERTPEHFRFNVKAHSLMTGHPTDPRRLPAWLSDDLPLRLRAARNVYTHHFSREAIGEVWRRFVAALEPLRAAGRFGAIMLQYPRWVMPTRESAAMLHESRERLGNCPASIEFRHRDWLSERIAPRTWALAVRDLAFTHVAVDAPPGMESSMPPAMEVTNSELAIVRLHGRRTATWEERNDVVTERYRYLYTVPQLAAWLPAIRRAADIAREVHLVFNNNHANYATTNAVEMHQLLLDGLGA